MAKTINPSKLLPSAKSTAIVKVGKPNIIAKTSPLSKGLLAKRENKDAVDANNKLVKVDKFLKSDLIVSKKKAEVKRKDTEKENFTEAEKKLETPQSKKFKLPGISAPSLGFMDRVKRFIFFTALGWALPKILEFLPKLQGFANIIGGVYNFAEGLFGKLFDGFMSLVKFGGDLKKKTLGFIAQSSGGDAKGFEKKFSELEKQFNNFANLSIVAGLVGLDMGLAALDEYNKQKTGSLKGGGDYTKGYAAGYAAGLASRGGRPRRPGEAAAGGTLAENVARQKLSRERMLKPEGPKGPLDRVRRGFRGAAAQLQTGTLFPKGAGIQKAIYNAPGKIKKIPQFGKNLISKLSASPLGKLGKPFSAFLGRALPFVGAGIGAIDAAARAKSGDKTGALIAGASAALDAFAGSVGLAAGGFLASIVGAPVAAALATAAGVATGISILLDVILLVRDVLSVFGIKTFSKGGRVVRKYQGGGTTRGGRPVGAPKRRGITPRKRKILFKLTPPKSQPGKDVGGEKEIKKLYPDPDKKMTLDEFLRSPMGQGSYTYTQYENDFKKRTKKPNPYKALTGTAKILKDIPLVGGLMGAAVDIALGQKPDVRVYRSLASGIGSLVESLANQKTNQSITSLMKEVKGFAEGGNVPESRRLKNDTKSLGSGDLISKLLETTITQKVNEAIQNLEKELKIMSAKSGEKTGGDEGAPGAPATTLPGGQAEPGVRLDPGQPGVDFTPGGSNNRSVFDGEVFEIGHQYNANVTGGDGRMGSGYGNYIVIRSKDPVNGKEFDGLYAHFPDGELSKWKKGDKVKRGDVLGRMATEAEFADPKTRSRVGSGTGPHTSLDFYSPGSNGAYPYWKQNLLPQVDPTFKKPIKKPQQTTPATPATPGPTPSNTKTGTSNASYYGPGFYGNQTADNTGKYILKRDSLWVAHKTLPFGTRVKFTYNGKTITLPVRDRGPFKPGRDWDLTEAAAEQLGIKSAGVASVQYEILGKQAGGLISPRKPNRPIPNSFAPYETPGGGMMIAIQPIIVEKQVPVSGGGNKMIAFPVPVAVNSNMDNAFIGG